MLAHHPVIRQQPAIVHFARGMPLQARQAPTTMTSIPPNVSPSSTGTGPSAASASSAVSQGTTPGGDPDPAAEGGAGSAEGDASPVSVPQSAPVNLPPCVGNCILLGDFSECGPSDLTCLCKSPKYHTSVDVCFKAQCSAEQAAIGASYSEQACWELSAIDNFTAPDVFNQTFINLQAILSSLCAALMLIAFIIGFFSIRSRRRRDAAASGGADSGAWTHMATMASRHGPGGTKSFTTSRGGFDPTATFASASYPSQTKSFGDVTIGSGAPPLGAGGRVKGFTNRMRQDEQDEWEMEEQERKAAVGGPVAGMGASGLAKIDEDADGADDKYTLTLGEDEAYMRRIAVEGLPDSPVTPTTIRSHGEEVDAYGSTVVLTRLDKGDGPVGRAI